MRRRNTSQECGWRGELGGPPRSRIMVFSAGCILSLVVDPRTLGKPCMRHSSTGGVFKSENAGENMERGELPGCRRTLRGSFRCRFPLAN